MVSGHYENPIERKFLAIRGDYRERPLVGYKSYFI